MLIIYFLNHFLLNSKYLRIEIYTLKEENYLSYEVVEHLEHET